MTSLIIAVISLEYRSAAARSFKAIATRPDRTRLKILFEGIESRSNRLIHLIRFLKLINVGERVTQIETTQGERALIVQLFEDFVGLDVVLMGARVVVSTVVNVGDIVTEAGVTYLIVVDI